MRHLRAEFAARLVALGGASGGVRGACARGREALSSCRSRRVEQGQHRQRGRRQGSDKEESGAFGTGLAKRKDAGGGRRRSRRDEGQVTATSHGPARREDLAGARR